VNRRSLELSCAGLSRARTGTEILLLGLLATTVSASHVPPTWATRQETKKGSNPLTGDPEAISQGKALFRVSCAFCHGNDAHGGTKGPDLGSGRWLHGQTDTAIFHNVTHGIPATEMPGQSFTDEETWRLVAYLRSLIPMSVAPSPGDAAAGERIFFGKGLCSNCHMVSGKGGRLGPDLSRVGDAKASRSLVKFIREPHKDIAQHYPTVIVVTKHGERILGVPRNEDAFSIQFMDQGEELHFFLKKDIQEVIHKEESLMPVYDERMLSETELQNLLLNQGGAQRCH